MAEVLESERTNFASCKALERCVLDVRREKATQTGNEISSFLTVLSLVHGCYQKL